MTKIGFDIGGILSKYTDYEAARFAADERAGEYDLSDDNGGEW